MSERFDLVIRGGTILDGAGRNGFFGDVAITASRVAAVGMHLGEGVEEIDATGLLVMPGFVDIHTHYDGQATWAGQLTPSSHHGVTTVVTGNCGVGFAPCRREDQDRLVDLMAGVEDIPEIVMAEGLSWAWESFPEYLDAVAARPHDMDIAAMAPHAAIRLYAMGAGALAHRTASREEVGHMTALMREAMAAGAIGLGTSRALQHRGLGGDTIPSVAADEQELLCLLGAVADGGGVFQVNANMGDALVAEREFEMLRRLCKATGVPTTFSLFQKHRDPEGWRCALRLAEDAWSQGLAIRPQVMGRPTGVLLGHQLSRTPFDDCPAYALIAQLPLAEKVIALLSPDVRRAILREAIGGDQQRYRYIFELKTEIDHEPSPRESVAAIAEQSGHAPAELAYEILLQDGGQAVLLEAIQNYADGSLSAPAEMMKSDCALLGLADGGAHYGLICDASYPTTMLAHWTRDRTRGPLFSLADMVRRLTSANAEAVGLRDRGRLETGFRADINVIDYRNLRLHRPQVVYDLPAGGRRIIQRADGYIATIVGGRVTYRNGASTGQLPGRLVRGPRPRPAMI